MARRGCGLKRLVEAAGAVKVSMPAHPVFDIACLKEQSRNKDGHEGSSDGVLSDYPTVNCGILQNGKDTWNSPEGQCLEVSMTKRRPAPRRRDGLAEIIVIPTRSTGNADG